MTKRIVFQLTCQYSGLPIGELSYNTIAGHAPWLSHWNGMQARHPIFSLEGAKLLAFTRGEWNRLSKASANGETSDAEDTLLRVSFLAVLHSLESVNQSLPGLPELHTVQNQMPRLFALAYWKLYLDSKRFCFPEYRVSKINANSDFKYVGDYLDVCFSIKDDYQHGVNDLIEKEKADAADRALKHLRNSWITPVSNKVLWRWIHANLDLKYKNDAWLQAIFCGSEKTILAYDKDEIQLLEEIIMSCCPAGTGPLKAVRERLEVISKIYVDNKEAFSVDFTEYEETVEILVAPNKADFTSLGAFYKANAIFYLKTRAQQMKDKK